VLGLSLRHVRRILAAYRKEGAAALAHGNRGSKPYNALDNGLKRRVLELWRSRPTLAATLSTSLSFWQNVRVSLFPALRCVCSSFGQA